MSDTTVTVIGMIVAFLTALITAFLAEPIKTYYQSKSDLKYLRIALYKEMFFNYQLISGWVQELKGDYTFGSSMLKNTLRAECYKHAVESQTSLFYRLHETDAINHLQGASLSTLYSYLDTDDKTISKEDKDLMGMSEGYVEIFEHNSYENIFDRKVLKTIMPMNKYQDLLKRGEFITSNFEKQKQSNTDKKDAQST